MRRRKRAIWWEPGPGARTGRVRAAYPEYDQWARRNVVGFRPRPVPESPRARERDPVPDRLQTLGEALTRSLTVQGHSVPTAAAAVGTTSEQFIEWALDRSDPGAAFDQGIMNYLGVDYYTLRGLTLRSQMRRVQLRIHHLPA